MNPVLLLNLNWAKSKETRFGELQPLIPLELSYLSSSLNNFSIKNELINLWLLNKDIKNFKNKIKKASILILNTGASYPLWRDGSSNLRFIKKNIKAVKNINPILKLVIVGQHGTVSPNEFFRAPVDFIIRGEPDIVTAKLVKAILEKKEYDFKGVCYKENGKWKVGKEYAVVSDLNKLPILKYNKAEVSKYKKPVQIGFGTPILYEASRGCYFNCSFCFRKGFRREFRKKGIDHIKEELDILKKTGVGYVYLIDECFLLDKEWSKNFCNLIRKYDIKWRCQTRPELLSKEMIRLMAKSGCKTIEIGLESVDKKILKSFNKSTIDLNKLEDDIHYIVENSIRPHLFCIVGSPYETKETIKKTLDYVLQFQMDKVDAYAKLYLDYPKMYSSKNFEYRSNSFFKKEVVRFNNKIWYKKNKLKLMNSIKHNSVTGIILNLIKLSRNLLLLSLPRFEFISNIGINTLYKHLNK